MASGKTSRTARTVASTVLVIPPCSWMLITRGRLPLDSTSMPPREPRSWISTSLSSLADLATQADQHAGRDVGVVGEPSQHPLELDVVLASSRDAATPFVGDREDAVDVGELALPLGPSRNCSATVLEVLAEQFTALMTAT